jgi:hypothetical protein
MQKATLMIAIAGAMNEGVEAVRRLHRRRMTRQRKGLGWICAPLAFAAIAMTNCNSIDQSAWPANANDLARARHLVFMPEAAQRQPDVVRELGFVRATSCQYPNDPQKGRIDAFEQLLLRAAQRGGNGIVGVHSERIINTRSPCWHGFEDTGIAVIFRSVSEQN